MGAGRAVSPPYPRLHRFSQSTGYRRPRLGPQRLPFSRNREKCRVCPKSPGTRASALRGAENSRSYYEWFCVWSSLDFLKSQQHRYLSSNYFSSKKETEFLTFSPFSCPWGNLVLSCRSAIHGTCRLTRTSWRRGSGGRPDDI